MITWLNSLGLEVGGIKQVRTTI